MPQDDGKGLVEHVAQLRTLALLDPETTTLDMAMVNVLEELAVTVDRLASQPPPERGFGSI